MNVRSKPRIRIENPDGNTAPGGASPSPGRSRSAWLDPGDLQLLAEIGLSAAARGYGSRVEPIFAALAILRPDNAAAAIGRALDAIARRDCDAAIEILKSQGIRARICAAEAQALLAVALVAAGRNAEARAICRSLVAGKSGPARRVAEGLLAAETVDA
jgi:hypothetical protein